MLGHPRHAAARSATPRRRDAVALAATVRRNDRRNALHARNAYGAHGKPNRWTRVKTTVCAIVTLLIGWWTMTVVLGNQMGWAGSLP